MSLLDAIPSQLLGSAFGDSQVSMDVLKGGIDGGSTFVDGVTRENWIATGATITGVLKELSEAELESGDDVATHHFRALGPPQAEGNDYLRQAGGTPVFRVSQTTDLLGLGKMTVYRLVEQVGLVV